MSPPEPDWNERYITKELPWDTGVPDNHLVELVETGVLAPGRALEIGCGTGTNSIWLAKQGFAVQAFDLSPVAIERASAKRDAAGVEVELSARDLFAEGPPPGPFDLVFDRGVFHVFDAPEQRARFAELVASALGEQGRWLSLIGSTEGPPREYGPPRRSVRDIAEAVEPALELVSLRAVMFEALVPTPAPAWLLLARQRATPAQPSSRRG